MTATPSARRKARSSSAFRGDIATLASVVLFIAVFGGWELAVRQGMMPAFILPAPSEVALRTLVDATTATTLTDAGYTLVEIIVGFGGALILGGVFGAMIALFPIVDRVLSPYIIGFQTIPKVAVAPVLIIWFGFGIESKIVIVTLICFFPILVNAAAGFRSTDPRQISLMKSLEATEWQIFVKVRLPNSMPFVMAGVYVSMVFAVIGAVVGEFIGSARGLGSLIVQRQAQMDVVGVFSIIVILTVIGIVLNALTRAVGRRVAFWSETENSTRM